MRDCAVRARADEDAVLGGVFVDLYYVTRVFSLSL
jgi:hypothetical protein